MIKLNQYQYPKVNTLTLDDSNSLEPLKDTFPFEKKMRDFKVSFGFDELNFFSFTIDGLLGFMCKLKGKLAVSLGESQAIIYAANAYKNLGFDVEFIELNSDGSVKLEQLESLNVDYVFLSSYVMDTFVKTDLEKAKSYIGEATLISNVSASLDYMESIDVALFDAYKLTGFQTQSIALHNGDLEEQYLGEMDAVALELIEQGLKTFESNDDSKELKDKMIDALQANLGEDFFFFVQPESTLENALHFGLKGIKAREMIRTLSLGGIFITNGEGCSLGLSRPSKVIQAMGYTELQSRQALSFSFFDELSDEDISKVVATIAKKYKQIKQLMND